MQKMYRIKIYTIVFIMNRVTDYLALFLTK